MKRCGYGAYNTTTTSFFFAQRLAEHIERPLIAARRVLE
jgi:hypothetical protein